MFVAGIAVRKPQPGMSEVPAALADNPQHFMLVDGWKHTGLFKKAPVQVRLFREDAKNDTFAVGFAAPKDFVKPDLMVYWVAANSTVQDTLPTNAILLGGFNAPALPLPDEAAQAGGLLVLYSLADNEIVDVSQPVRTGDATQ